MPSTYQIHIEGLDPIVVTKKKGMRSLRMRINAKGACVVSAPWYVSRSSVQKFINERRQWIQQHSHKSQKYSNGMQLHDGTTLSFAYGANRNTVSMGSSALHFNLRDQDQENYIEKKIIEFLSNAAENILLPELHQTAKSIGLPFHQAFIKRLHSRWGSCDSHKTIVLNMYLVQLPQSLRQYVIVHELAHTVHMNHSADFWRLVELHCPNYKDLRKQLRSKNPKIYTQ